MHALVFFGGYRQKEVRVGVHDDALASFRKRAHATGPAPVELVNYREGKETLSDRWDRTRRWWMSHRHEVERASILGYSMGSHLAVRLALECCGDPRVPVGITLLAPDPKYLHTPLDRRPGAGNAYDQASELWDGGVPGIELERALSACPPSQVQIAYSERDPVAVYPGNVERLAGLPSLKRVKADDQEWWPADIQPRRIHEYLFEAYTGPFALSM